MRFFGGLVAGGWNLSLRLCCALPLVALGFLPCLWLVGDVFLGRSFPAGALIVAVPGAFGAFCAWRSLVLRRLAWWPPGFILLCPLLFVMTMSEGFPDVPDPDARRMPAVSTALLGAAIGGFWLARRSPRDGQEEI